VAVHPVSARTATMDRRPPALRALDRVAAGFILILLGVGSLFLWVGIPYGLLWLFAKMTDSWNGHFLLSVLLIPIAMALFAPVLFWLNGLYLRVTGVLTAEDGEDDPGRRLRGPLEIFLYAGMLMAIVALCVWFFGYAHNPPEIIW
jgi:hypothetical protein